MSILAVAVCDKCGKQVAYDHIGKTHIKRWLREEKWTFGKKDLCPKCNGKSEK